MPRGVSDRRSRRTFLALVAVLAGLTCINYTLHAEMTRASAPAPAVPPDGPSNAGTVPRVSEGPRIVVYKTEPPKGTPAPAPTAAPPSRHEPPTNTRGGGGGASRLNGDSDSPNGIPDDATDPPDKEVNRVGFLDALQHYDHNLNVSLPRNQDPKQPTNAFYDVNELPDHGVLLPQDPTRSTAHLHIYCDPGNTSFSIDRDRLCQAYLANIYNMRSIKAMSSILDTGRTIKFKLFYNNNNLTAIVKVSQMKFFFESASEYLAYVVDRVLHLNRVPTTAYVPLPLDYMRAAAGILSPFYTQWFDLFVPNYEFTRENMITCEDGGDRANKCALAAVQLWMHDVHSAVMSNLRLPFYKLDNQVVEKYFVPRTRHRWPPKPRRHFSASELCDRFIFDFLIGNTDRGLNDHNNFVYGGCDASTSCKPRPAPLRTKYAAKYAFIDHGSSFHSHKEPEGNVFTGNTSRVCRFRRSTYQSMKPLARAHGDGKHTRPFIDAIRHHLPRGIFNVVRQSVFKKMQDRLDKVVRQVDECIKNFGEAEVFSLLEENPAGVYAA